MADAPMRFEGREQDTEIDPEAAMARNAPPDAGTVMAARLAASATGLGHAWPLLLPGAVGVTSGGLIAAGAAHAPTSATVWLAAYLVLVVGVGQLALAIGQALLTSPAVDGTRVRRESLLFNLGSAGVIAGTIGGGFVPVALGTLSFVGALGVFVLAVRATAGGYAVYAYRALIAFLAISALVGLLLSASVV